MEKTVSEKNTKSQILEAYEKLLKKVEEKSNDNPREVQQRKENTQTLKKATEASGESIINEISKIKSEFTSSLETMASELIEERKKLETIQDAISIEEKSSGQRVERAACSIRKRVCRKREIIVGK